MPADRRHVKWGELKLTRGCRSAKDDTKREREN